MCVRARTGPEDTSSCMNKWPKFSWPFFLLHGPLSPSLILWSHGEFFMINWQMGKIGVLVDRCFCTKCRHHLKVDSYRTTNPLCDFPVQQRWMEIFQVAVLGAGNLVAHPGKRNGQMCDYIPIHELWLKVCWVIRDFEGILLGIWRQGNLWKRYVNTSLQKSWRYLCLIKTIIKVWPQQRRI